MCHNVTNAPKDTIFLEMRPEVKVTVTRKQYVTLCDPKLYPHTKFGIPTSNIIEDMLWTGFFYNSGQRSSSRSQGPENPM